MKIGILGGGQLGRMFLQKALNYNQEFSVLDPSTDASCKNICKDFVLGDFNDYETVLNFGEDKEVITIEIEHVNVEALLELEKKGVKVIPNARCIQMIQQKQLQKEFYLKNNIPSPTFINIKNKKELENQTIQFPFVQKLNTGGYDGKGVQMIHNESEMHLMWDAPSVIETLVDLDKELSIIVAKNEKGDIAYFPVTEMVADPIHNLLDFNICPASINKTQEKTIQDIAKKLVDCLESPGLFAIELFLDKKGEIWINEVAPRLHNSGHQSQEGNYHCQFEQFYRVITNLPLAEVGSRCFSGMLNLVGEPNYEGDVYFEGLDNLLKISQTYVHLYGKKTTKSGRKMGHINCLAENKEALLEKLFLIKTMVKVISK